MKFIGKYFLALFISFLLMTLPFSSIAHAVKTDKQADQQMPCHQQDKLADKNLCPETGLNSCDCCDHYVPVGITAAKTLPNMLLYVTLIKFETALPQIITRVQNPPYRPPRISA